MHSKLKQLRADVVPKTAENFRALCTGESEGREREKFRKRSFFDRVCLLCFFFSFSLSPPLSLAHLSPQFQLPNPTIHRREGRRQDGQAPALQGLELPPRHHRVSPEPIVFSLSLCSSPPPLPRSVLSLPFPLFPTPSNEFESETLIGNELKNSKFESHSFMCQVRFSK